MNSSCKGKDDENQIQMRRVFRTMTGRRAIRAFQANQGLPVTGLIDRKLISALQLG
jgi:hypothetical protein